MKRVFDVIVALLAFPVFATAFLLIAPAIWLDSGSPVLFKLASQVAAEKLSTSGNFEP